MRNLLLIGFLSCLFLSVKAQHAEIKALLDSAGLLWYVDYDKTDQLVRKAEKIISEAKQEGYLSDILQLYDLRINSCYAFSELQLMRQYLDEFEGLLSSYKKQLGPDEFQLFQSRNKISRAQYHFEINDYTKALELFTELQTKFKKLPESREVCTTLFTINNYVAGIHQRKGEYEAAINQNLSSIHYYECSHEAGAGFNSIIYRNIGFLFLQKGDFLQSGMYLKLAEDSLQSLLNVSMEQGARIALSLYETQASYYEKTGHYDSALLAMQKAIPLLTLQNIDNEFKGRINQSLGKLFLIEDRFNEAKKCFDQAEIFFLKSQSTQTIYLTSLYLGNAELYEKQKQITKALEYCDEAIARVVVNFKPDANGNPVLDRIISKKLLFNVLQKKSRLLEKLYTERSDVNLLLKSFNTNQLSLALLDSTANEFSLDKDKIILSEQSYTAFEDGIRISNMLYQKTGQEKYFTNVISMIEKSKGVLLLENLRMVNRFSGINQEWLEREKALKAEMLLTEQKLYETELKAADELHKLRERYASTKRDYSNLIEQIKREAPDYYKLRFDHSVVSLETIQQKLLKPGEALVEFFVGDSVLAVAGFTREKKYLTVKKMLPDFTEKMNQFRTVLTTGNSSFLELSSEFYNFLLKDCLTELGSEINSLIVIPDGLLGYLPFEVLIQSRDPKVVFLNDRVSVHYANSATYLIEQMQRKPSDSRNFFAGFVSSGLNQSGDTQAAARGQQWATLQGAEQEVASITALFSSKFKVFSPANKADFIKYASDYKILHFAMHSSLHDENPMMSVMVFSDPDSSSNLLTAIELYSMKLNSELAVLSACNTGVGQLHRGEGLMSFSRAFAYAGVPSAVISLWKVPDIATSKIMVSFYRHLQNGETKDKALQLARQDFIRDNPEMSHPYYWSGFILTGNAEAITFPRSMHLVWISLVLFVILLALFWGRKRFVKE